MVKHTTLQLPVQALKSALKEQEIEPWQFFPTNDPFWRLALIDRPGKKLMLVRLDGTSPSIKDLTHLLEIPLGHADVSLEDISHYMLAAGNSMMLRAPILKASSQSAPYGAHGGRGAQNTQQTPLRNVQMPLTFLHYTTTGVSVLERESVRWHQVPKDLQASVDSTHLQENDTVAHQELVAIAASSVSGAPAFALLERFVWMPWVPVKARGILPMRLRVVEQKNGTWSMKGSLSVPLGLTGFLSSFQDTITLVGPHKICVVAWQEGRLTLAQEFSWMDVDESFAMLPKVQVEGVSPTQGVALLLMDAADVKGSAGQESDKAASPFAIPRDKVIMAVDLLGKKMELLRGQKRICCSNVLTDGATGAMLFLSAHADKRTVELTVVTSFSNVHFFPIKELGILPPPVYAHLCPPRGKLALWGQDSLAIFWRRAPLARSSLFFLDGNETPTGKAPLDVVALIVPLQGLRKG